MSKTNLITVGASELVIKVLSSERQKITVDGHFSKVIIDSPGVEAFVDLTGVDYDSVQFTSGSKIHDVALSILDFSKLASVEGVAMCFTDHQMDTSLAFFVKKFADKGYTLPKALDEDFGWLWFDFDYVYTTAYLYTKYLKIEYQDGTIVDNLDNSLTETDENYLFKDKKRFRILEMASDSNIFDSDQHGLRGDFYINNIHRNDRSLYISDVTYPSKGDDDLVKYGVLKRVFVENSSFSNIAIRNYGSNGSGLLDYYPDEVLPYTPCQDFVVYNSACTSTYGDIDVYGSFGMWCYNQYFVNVAGMTDSYNCNVVRHVVYNCPKDKNIGGYFYSAGVFEGTPELYVLNCGYDDIDRLVTIEPNSKLVIEGTGVNNLHSNTSNITNLNPVIIDDAKINQTSYIVSDLHIKNTERASQSESGETYESLYSFQAKGKFYCFENCKDVIEISGTELENVDVLKISKCNSLAALKIPKLNSRALYIDAESSANVHCLDISESDYTLYEKVLKYIDKSKLTELYAEETTFPNSVTCDIFTQLTSLETLDIVDSNITIVSDDAATGNIDTIYCNVSHLAAGLRTGGDVYLRNFDYDEPFVYTQHGASLSLHLEPYYGKVSKRLNMSVSNLDNVTFNSSADIAHLQVANLAATSLNLNNAAIDDLDVSNSLNLATISNISKLGNVNIEGCRALTTFPLYKDEPWPNITKQIDMNNNDGLSVMEAGALKEDDSCGDVRKYLSALTYSGDTEQKLVLNIKNTAIRIAPDKILNETSGETATVTYTDFINSSMPSMELNSHAQDCVTVESEVYRIYDNSLKYSEPSTAAAPAGYIGKTYYSRTSGTSQRACSIYVKSSGEVTIPVYAFGSSSSYTKCAVMIDGVQSGYTFLTAQSSSIPSSLAGYTPTNITIPGDGNLHVVDIVLMTQARYYTINVVFPKSVEPVVAEKLEATVTADLNNQWKLSTFDCPTGYSTTDGYTTFMSESNIGVGDSHSKMYIRFSDVTKAGPYKLKIVSSAETNYDYVSVYALDSESSIVGEDTANSSPSDISNYKEFAFDIPADGNDHFVMIDFHKDSSVNASLDRGFVLIETPDNTINSCLPTLTITGDNSATVGYESTYTVSSTSSNSYYRWECPGSNGMSQTGTNMNTCVVRFDTAGVYTLTCTDTVSGASTSKTINVIAITLYITGEDTIDTYQSVTYNVTRSTGSSEGSYSWSANDSDVEVTGNGDSCTVYVNSNSVTSFTLTCEDTSIGVSTSKTISVNAQSQSITLSIAPDDSMDNSITVGEWKSLRVDVEGSEGEYSPSFEWVASDSDIEVSYNSYDYACSVMVKKNSVTSGYVTCTETNSGASASFTLDISPRVLTIENESYSDDFTVGDYESLRVTCDSIGESGLMPSYEWYADKSEDEVSVNGSSDQCSVVVNKNSVSSVTITCTDIRTGATTSQTINVNPRVITLKYSEYNDSITVGDYEFFNASANADEGSTMPSYEWTTDKSSDEVEIQYNYGDQCNFVVNKNSVSSVTITCTDTTTGATASQTISVDPRVITLECGNSYDEIPVGMSTSFNANVNANESCKNPSYEWTADNPSVSINDYGDSCYVSLYDESLIGQRVTITCTDTISGATASITCDVVDGGGYA